MIKHVSRGHRLAASFFACVCACVDGRALREERFGSAHRNSNLFWSARSAIGGEGHGRASLADVVYRGRQPIFCDYYCKAPFGTRYKRFGFTVAKKYGVK